jgi:predicted HTH transcriptional regulator
MLSVPCNTPTSNKQKSRSPSQSPPISPSLTPALTPLHTPSSTPLNIEKPDNFPKFDNTYIYIENNYFPHVEDETIELKNKPLTQMEMSIIFSGFMNHLGGFLFMGIADNGKICGINMTDKEIDQFKLFVDGVQQTCIHPQISGVKVNVFDVYTYDLQKTGKYVFRLDIPKMEQKKYAKDGNSYTRYNASFRTDGITQFIHIDKLRNLQIQYNNLKKENMILKQQLSNFMTK